MTRLTWSLSSWFAAILQEVTTAIKLLASGQATGINRLTFTHTTVKAWGLCLHASKNTK